MPMSMYQSSAPVFARALGQLKHLLQKAATHAAAKKIDESVFLGGRLAPDMFPLSRQVQIATDFARGTVARLSGHEPPAWEDKEASFADLIARVDRAIQAVNEVKAASIEGSQSRSITRPIRGQPHTFTGEAFLANYALPNFWFHSTMVYAILRSMNVEIGKGDWIGALS